MSTLQTEVDSLRRALTEQCEAHEITQREVDSLLAAREQDRLYIQRLLAPTPTTDEIRDKFRGNETGLCRALIFHANQQERRLAVADAALAEALDGLPNLQEKIRKALADVTPGADTDPDDVDIMRAELQSAKDEAERARGDAQEYANRLLEWSQKPGFATTAQLDSTQRYCARLEKENATLSAECEALKSSAVEAIMVSSSVFGVWGDKFAPGTVEDFRAKEKSFLAIASKNAGKGV